MVGSMTKKKKKCRVNEKRRTKKFLSKNANPKAKQVAEEEKQKRFFFSHRRRHRRRRRRRRLLFTTRDEVEFIGEE